MLLSLWRIRYADKLSEIDPGDVLAWTGYLAARPPPPVESHRLTSVGSARRVAPQTTNRFVAFGER